MRRVTGLVLGVLLGAHAAAASPSGVERSRLFLMGQPAGFQEARYSPDGTLQVHFEFNDRGRGPRLDAKVRLNPDGTLAAVDTTGVSYFKSEVNEHFAGEEGRASWKNGAEDESRTLSGPAFYLSLEAPPEETALLARALLLAPERRMTLLPAGEARIEKVTSARVHGASGEQPVVLYALGGLDLAPTYVWLDESQRFFALYSTWQSLVREGYEDALARLGERQEAERRRLAEGRARDLTRWLTTPLAIQNVRLFDPATASVRDDQVVVVDGGRIGAVGTSDAVSIPPGAEILDGQGRFLMPGLWDMHAHYGADYEGLLDIAAGVTTVRDLANDADALAGRILAIEAGREVGPRILKAGFIDGRGPYAGPTKVFADDEAEARAAIEKYAATGYEQIKIYSSIKPELMPVIARFAHAKGLRVSGHVPAFMTAREFVDFGADEIQHINFVVLNFLFEIAKDTRTPLRFTAVAENAATLDLSSPEVRDLLGFLKQRGTVIDPTVSVFEGMFLDRPGRPGPGYAAIVDRMPPTWQRAIRSGTGGLPVQPGLEARYRDSFQRLVDLVGALHRSGVRLVAGTDGIGGLALARELELYVAAGIAPKEVLRIATLGAAEVMKRDREHGRVAPGYVADLLLLDGDPTVNLADIRKVRTVIRGDRVFDSAAVYRALGVKP